MTEQTPIDVGAVLTAAADRRIRETLAQMPTGSRIESWVADASGSLLGLGLPHDLARNLVLDRIVAAARARTTALSTPANRISKAAAWLAKKKLEALV